MASMAERYSKASVWVGVAEAEGISSSASSFARRGMASREEALDGESAVVGDGGDGGGDVGVNVENR